MSNIYQDEKHETQSRSTPQLKKTICKANKQYSYPMKNAYPILIRNFMKYFENMTQLKNLNDKKVIVSLEINRILRQASNNHGEKLLYAVFNLDYSHIPQSWAFYKEQLIEFLKQTDHQLRRSGLEDEYRSFRETFIQNIKNPKEWKFSTRGRKCVEITNIANQIKQLRETEQIDVKQEQVPPNNTYQLPAGFNFTTLPGFTQFQQFASGQLPFPILLVPVQIPMADTPRAQSIPN